MQPLDPDVTAQTALAPLEPEREAGRGLAAVHGGRVLEPHECIVCHLRLTRDQYFAI